MKKFVNAMLSILTLLLFSQNASAAWQKVPTGSSPSLTFYRDVFIQAGESQVFVQGVWGSYLDHRFSITCSVNVKETDPVNNRIIKGSRRGTGARVEVKEIFTKGSHSLFVFGDNSILKDMSCSHSEFFISVSMAAQWKLIMDLDLDPLERN